MDSFSAPLRGKPCGAQKCVSQGLGSRPMHVSQSLWGGGSPFVSANQQTQMPNHTCDHPQTPPVLPRTPPSRSLLPACHSRGVEVTLSSRSSVLSTSMTVILNQVCLTVSIRSQGQFFIDKPL